MRHYPYLHDIICLYNKYKDHDIFSTNFTGPILFFFEYVMAVNMSSSSASLSLLQPLSFICREMHYFLVIQAKAY